MLKNVRVLTVAVLAATVFAGGVSVAQADTGSTPAPSTSTAPAPSTSASPSPDCLSWD
jgi:hypothetical protein